MLPPERALHVARMLMVRPPMTLSEIARRSGVSRPMVAAIRDGKRNAQAGANPGPPHRCRHCGALVYGECMPCSLFALLGGTRTGSSSRRDPIEPLRLDLKPGHRERYEKIRAAKLAAARAANPPDARETCRCGLCADVRGLDSLTPNP